MLPGCSRPQKELHHRGMALKQFAWLDRLDVLQILQCFITLWFMSIFSIQHMQYAICNIIYLDIDLFTFLRCVSSRRPLEEIPLKATKDSCQKSLETTLGSAFGALKCQIEHPEDSQFGLDDEFPEKRSRRSVGADSGLKYV